MVVSNSTFTRLLTLFFFSSCLQHACSVYLLHGMHASRRMQLEQHSVHVVLNDFYVVGWVESDFSILPTLAPTLLVLVLKFLKGVTRFEV